MIVCMYGSTEDQRVIGDASKIIPCMSRGCGPDSAIKRAKTQIRFSMLSCALRTMHTWGGPPAGAAPESGCQSLESPSASLVVLLVGSAQEGVFPCMFIFSSVTQILNVLAFEPYLLIGRQKDKLGSDKVFL